MNRLLVILLLIVAGVRPGAMPSAGESISVHRHASGLCCEPTPPPPMSCCSETAPAAPSSGCPMTGGECECFNRPVDAPPPLPESTMPLSGIKPVPGSVSIETVPAPAGSSVCSARRHLSLLGLARERSQNEAQALLSVWQT